MYYHHPWAAHHYGFAHDIGHMVLSGVIHGLIYALIFKVFHYLGLWSALAVTIAVISGLWLLGRKRGGGGV